MEVKSWIIHEEGIHLWLNASKMKTILHNNDTYLKGKEKGHHDHNRETYKVQQH